MRGEKERKHTLASGRNRVGCLLADKLTSLCLHLIGPLHIVPVMRGVGYLSLNRVPRESDQALCSKTSASSISVRDPNLGRLEAMSAGVCELQDGLERACAHLLRLPCCDLIGWETVAHEHT